MALTGPTYASDGNGKVIAFHGNAVIASGTDFAKVSCTAEEYFNQLRNTHAKTAMDEARKAATHITTPNGDKGIILGRTASLWSDEITVRFENGQIRRYATFVDDGLKYSTEQVDAPKSPVEFFQRKLDEVTTPGRPGLTARLNDLDGIRRGASHLASQGVSYTDGQALHQIVLAADAERNEVREALDHLETVDAEAFEAPKMAYTAVEQVSLGRSDSWLEVVAQEMVAESEAQDFDKLLADGPIELVSKLETGALANTGAVREIAQQTVHAKTAGFQGEAVENYRDAFVAATEMARRREYSYRQDAVKQTVAKEASVAENTPDEALFL